VCRHWRWRPSGAPFRGDQPSAQGCGLYVDLS
jgi:hypothetical protein